MADDNTARITVALPKEVTKALRMKAISDECSSSEIIINALSTAYPDDELLSKPLAEAKAKFSDADSEDEYDTENDYSAN